MSDPSEPAFPVAVAGRLYGPVPVSQLVADLAAGALSSRAIFWDGHAWVPVVALLPPGDEGAAAAGGSVGGHGGGAGDGGAAAAPPEAYPVREWERAVADECSREGDAGRGRGEGDDRGAARGEWGADGGWGAPARAPAPTGTVTAEEAAWAPPPRPPPPNRWRVLDRRDRYLVLYGDLLMLEGGTPSFRELLGARAITDQIPVEQIVSATLTPDGAAVRFEATAFVGFYEPVALACRLAPADAERAQRELEAEGVRVRVLAGENGGAGATPHATER